MPGSVYNARLSCLARDLRGWFFVSVWVAFYMLSINNRIAEELGVRPQQVAAAVALLDEGSTVPFIARYRKEVTGSLDDTQLRNLEERLRYLR